MSADVELDGVTIRFGDFAAVKSATLKIKNGRSALIHKIVAFSPRELILPNQARVSSQTEAS